MLAHRWCNVGPPVHHYTDGGPTYRVCPVSAELTLYAPQGLIKYFSQLKNYFRSVAQFSTFFQLKLKV